MNIALVTRFALGAVVLSACNPTTQKSSDTTIPAARQASDTGTVADQRNDTTALAMADSLSPAFQQFDRFLSLAVATRALHVGITDSVYTSGSEPEITEGDTAMRWIAAARILAVSTRGDTGHAAAVITEVARQAEKHDGYEATYGVRDDTAHWVLVRGVDSTGKWLVNGDADEGFGVFPIGRDIRWVTGSRAKAIAAVDSIRRARGLAIVR
jgi:hypothetical protein